MTVDRSILSQWVSELMISSLTFLMPGLTTSKVRTYAKSVAQSKAAETWVNALVSMPSAQLRRVIDSARLSGTGRPHRGLPWPCRPSRSRARKYQRAQGELNRVPRGHYVDRRVGPAVSVAVGLSAGRSQGSNKIAIILKIFVDVDHLK